MLKNGRLGASRKVGPIGRTIDLGMRAWCKKGRPPPPVVGTIWSARPFPRGGPRFRWTRVQRRYRRPRSSLSRKNQLQFLKGSGTDSEPDPGDTMPERLEACPTEGLSGR